MGVRVWDRVAVATAAGSSWLRIDSVGLSGVGVAPCLDHGIAAVPLSLMDDQLAGRPGSVEEPRNNRWIADVAATVDHGARNIVQAIHSLEDRG